MTTPPEHWRRLAAAGHRGDEGFARGSLTDADADSRTLALGALERMGRLDDVALTAAFADPSPVVRRRAATLAARHRGVDLTSLLGDADASVVEAAAWALGEHETVTPSTFATLVELATGADDPLVREAAVAALGAIGDVAGLPAILQACTDRATVRRRAVLALAPFEGPDVDAAIQAALDDRDWQVRQSAEDIAGPSAAHHS